MTVVDHELFFFFAAVILAAASVSVLNSIVKFADLMILRDSGRLIADLMILILKIAAFSGPISACHGSASVLFFPPISAISVMVLSSLKSTAHLFLSCFSPHPTSEFV